jgi:hypothetical protein
MHGRFGVFYLGLGQPSFRPHVAWEPPRFTYQTSHAMKHPQHLLATLLSSLTFTTAEATVFTSSCI